jgi:hypothetical protein
MQRNLTFIFFVSIVLFTLSCSKDNNKPVTTDTPTATDPRITDSIPLATVTPASITITEGDSIIFKISIAKPALSDIHVNRLFKMEGAVFNGDFTRIIPLDTGLIIHKGETSTILIVKTFDDKVVEEADQTIHLSFSSTQLSFGDGTYVSDTSNMSQKNLVITITDNDHSRASEGLEVALIWDTGDMVDMDLYFATDVVLNNNSSSDGDVESYRMVDSSTNKYGFEDLLLSKNMPDGIYYVVIAYKSGNRKVTATLNYNAPNFNFGQSKYVMQATEVGNQLFVGPFNKKGDAFNPDFLGNIRHPRSSSLSTDIF